MTPPPALDVRHVSRRGSDRPILDDLSFTAAPGEILVLLGDSGSGKTTTLRLIAGLDSPDAGEIWLDGARVSSPTALTPPEDRGIGMVFQDYALFPHLTAAGNIAFALHRLPAPARAARVTAMLARVGLDGLGDRYPHQMSGGEQQRVALARALAASPRLVLLDEPFSNLDARRRRQVRSDVVSALRQSGATALFVTHDQDEALHIADRIAVLRAGRLLQIGTPRALYDAPASREVAAFIGEAQFIPGTAHGGSVETALGMLALAEPRTGPVEVVIRPERLLLTPDESGAATVTDARFYGHDQSVDVVIGDLRLTARTHPDPLWSVGMRVGVTVQGAVRAYSAGGV